MHWKNTFEGIPMLKSKHYVSPDQGPKHSRSKPKLSNHSRSSYKFNSSRSNLPFDKLQIKSPKLPGKSSDKNSRCFQSSRQHMNEKPHSQTYNFIRKYFGSSTVSIPIDIFIQKVLEEYEALWGTQNINTILDDFTYKITNIFGCECVYVSELIRLTHDDGMIGLILRIFKEIKNQQTSRASNFVSFSQNPQIMSMQKSLSDRLTENENIQQLKNIIQEFMQTMYKCMEDEIYTKFNIQMRRMVIKYRQSEKLIKQVNQKLNYHADVFELEKKFKEKQKNYQMIIQELRRQREQIKIELNKEKDILWNERREKQKIVEEKNKLKEQLEKYHQLFLNKALEPNYNSRSENMLSSKSSHSNQQPVKITIDTAHFVHKGQTPEKTPLNSGNSFSPKLFGSGCRY